MNKSKISLFPAPGELTIEEATISATSFSRPVLAIPHEKRGVSSQEDASYLLLFLKAALFSRTLPQLVIGIESTYILSDPGVGLKKGCATEGLQGERKRTKGTRSVDRKGEGGRREGELQYVDQL